MAPRDYPVAAGADPAYPVTEAEERSPESVAEGARRELLDGHFSLAPAQAVAPTVDFCCQFLSCFSQRSLIG